MTAMPVKSGVLRQMSALPQRGRISWSEVILLAVCVAWVAFGVAPTFQDVVVLSFLFAGLALAWNIAGGCAGLISFGHAAFFGIGAYTSTILFLNYNVTPWLGIFAGGVAAAIAGAVLSLICARLKGPFFILSSLAFAEVVRIVALNWSSVTGGAEGLSIPPMPDPANMVLGSKAAYEALMLVYLLAAYAITRWLEASRFGFYLFAVRDNDDAAAAAGINPLAVRPVAMGYVEAASAAPDTAVNLMVRGKALPGRVVRLPFVPHRYFKS